MLLLNRRQKVLNGIGQRFGRCIRKSACLLRALFPALTIARDKNAGDGEAPCSLNVGNRIANYNAVGRRCLREIAECLLKQSCSGLSAFALAFVVRAVIEGINMSFIGGQMALEFLVQPAHVIFRVESQSHAALVGNDDDDSPGCVERGDGLLCAGQWVEVTPPAHVFTFRRLAIDHSIAVKENIPDTGKRAMRFGDRMVAVHCMIAKSLFLF